MATTKKKKTLAKSKSPPKVSLAKSKSPPKVIRNLTVPDSVQQIKVNVQEMEMGIPHLASGMASGLAGLGGSMALVANGMMKPMTAAIILGVVGAGMTALGVHQKNSHLLSSGLGCFSAAGYNAITVKGVDAHLAWEKRKLLKEKEGTAST